MPHTAIRYREFLLDLPDNRQQPGATLGINLSPEIGYSSQTVAGDLGFFNMMACFTLLNFQWSRLVFTVLSEFFFKFLNERSIRNKLKRRMTKWPTVQSTSAPHRRSRFVPDRWQRCTPRLPISVGQHHTQLLQ